MNLGDNTSLFDLPVSSTESTEEEIIQEANSVIDLFPEETPEAPVEIEGEEEGEEEVIPTSETEVVEGDEEEIDVEAVFSSFKEALLKKKFLEVEDPDALKTEEDLVTAYKGKIESKAQQSALEDLNQKLINRGIDDYHLDLAFKLANGVEDSSITELNYYKSRSEVSFDKLSTQEAISYVSEYLDRTNVTASAKKRLLESLEADEEFLETSFGDALEFNKNSFKEIDEDQRNVAKANLEDKERAQKESIEKFQSILKSGEIMGEKITDPEKFKRMINDYTTSVKIGDKEYPTTEWGKFLLDFQNDIELRLFLFKQFKFKDEEVKEIKEKAQEEGKLDLLKNFKKQPVTKKKKEDTTNNTPGLKSYILGPGGITKKS